MTRHLPILVPLLLAGCALPAAGPDAAALGDPADPCVRSADAGADTRDGEVCCTGGEAAGHAARAATDAACCADAHAAPEAAVDPAATARLAEAAAALGADDPQGCLAALGAAPPSGPDAATWHLLRAMARLDLGRPGDAADDLRTVVTLDPDDAGSWALLGRARFELRELDAAREALVEATERDPLEPQHFTSLGLVCLDAARWDEAHAAFAQALELDPGALAAHRGLARLYRMAGLPEHAVSALERCVSLDPEDPALRLQLGHALRDLGLRAEAFAAYEAADLLEPGNPWIAANLGAVQLERGDAASAREHFRDARRGFASLGVMQPEVERSMGQALLALGRPRDALEALRTAFDADPAMPGLGAELGLLLLDLGRAGEAREVLAATDRFGQLDVTALYELCRLEERHGDPAAAADLARRLLDGALDDPERALAGARLHLRSELPAVRDAAAAARLLEALVDDALRRHGPTWLLLAEARVEAGALDAAVDAVDRALELLAAGDPAAERARARRAQLVARLAARDGGER